MEISSSKVETKDDEKSFSTQNIENLNFFKSIPKSVYLTNILSYYNIRDKIKLRFLTKDLYLTLE